MASVTRSLVICTTPRTGSNYLCEVLLTAWRFGWPAEWFNPATIESFAQGFGLEKGYPLTDYRDRILADRHSPNGVFGLKLMWEHFPQLVERLHREGVTPDRVPTLAALERLLPSPRYLLLEREDVLGQAISHLKAKQTQAWIQRDPAERYDAEKLVYDFDAIEAEIAAIHNQCAAWRQLFVRDGRPVLELTYESVMADRATAIRRIADWMGEDPDAASFREPDNIQIQRDALSNEWRVRYESDRRVRGSA